MLCTLLFFIFDYWQICHFKLKKEVSSIAEEILTKNPAVKILMTKIRKGANAAPIDKKQ